MILDTNADVVCKHVCGMMSHGRTGLRFVLASYEALWHVVYQQRLELLPGHLRFASRQQLNLTLSEYDRRNVVTSSEYRHRSSQPRDNKPGYQDRFAMDLIPRYTSVRTELQ